MAVISVTFPTPLNSMSRRAHSRADKDKPYFEEGTATIDRSSDIMWLIKVPVFFLSWTFVSRTVI